MGLFDAFSADSNRQLARQTANQQESAINKGKQQGRQDINTGTRKAAVPLNQAVAGFQPFQSAGVQGVGMLPNALGLNGQEGYNSAVGAYQQSPGFQFSIDQANQNVLRNNAATGNVLSGNTGIALSDRARELQNLDYNKWIQNLFSLSDEGLRGAAGGAQGLQSLGNLFENAGQNKANIATGAASNLANIYGQQGQNLASANNTANTNTWAAILGLANAAASAVPGGGGGSSATMPTPTPPPGGTFPGWAMGR